MVIFGISTSDQSETALLENMLTFQPEDYADTKYIAIYGMDDALRDGDIDYSVYFYLITSEDPFYKSSYGETHRTFALQNIQSKVCIKFLKIRIDPMTTLLR